MHGRKPILIIAQGPPPTPEQSHVEGGGLRAWGLARGISANAPELDVTIAFDERYQRPGHSQLFDGIAIKTWNHETVGPLARGYDSVIISYCMGEISRSVARALDPDQQLILDCYVPIFCEYSARESLEPELEFARYLDESRLWNETLARGDLFLCAHQNQKHYYQGVLSALGRLNPITYGAPLILVVPYGIHREGPAPTDRPITRLVDDPRARKVLWFGGIYPWFDTRGLVDAIAAVNATIPTRLVMVGTRNPFTTHPAFLASYRDQIAAIEASPHRELVFFHDWVHYNERADWYLDADLIVMINKPGDENALAWRTRLVDYAWASMPIVTNGGDALGEELLAAGAAARLLGLKPAQIAQTLGGLLEDPEALQSIRDNLAAFRTRLFWDKVTEPLSAAIKSRTLAADRLAGPRPGARDARASRAPVPGIDQARRLAALAWKFPAHIREHGLAATARKIGRRIEGRLAKRAPEPAHPGARIVVLAHRLDLSGAPYVLMDVLAHLAARGNGGQVRFYTHPPAVDSNIEQLRAVGIRTNLIADADRVPEFLPGDRVMLNTLAFSPAARESVWHAIDRGVISQIAWYVHEDSPHRFFTPREARRIRTYLENGKIIMFGPSYQTCENYRRFFGVEMVREPYRVDLPGRYHRVREPDDFRSLRFIVSGTMLDGRKGQHAILYALAACDRLFIEADRARYRDFTLTFIGLEDDWYSEQLARHRAILGDRLILHPKTTREPGLDRIAEANVTVCYSLSETMGIFVFEGMLAGHPILRNDCSGMTEQLEVGGNGFRLDSTDFWQVVDTFERVLNREKTSNELLAAMSARSYAIGLEQRGHEYRQLIDVMIGDERRPPSRPHVPQARSRGRARRVAAGGAAVHWPSERGER